jgi:hypothetical protein
MDEDDRRTWRDFPIISHFVDHSAFYRGAIYFTAGAALAGAAISTGVEVFSSGPDYSFAILDGTRDGATAGALVCLLFGGMGHIVE